MAGSKIGGKKQIGANEAGAAVDFENTSYTSSSTPGTSSVKTGKQHAKGHK